MPKLGTKQQWRNAKVMEVVWASAESGGATAIQIAEETAPEGKTTGVSGRILSHTLWQLQRKGLIVACWHPVGKRMGARYVVLPGPNARKEREHARLRAEKTESAKPPKPKEETSEERVARMTREGLERVAKRMAERGASCR